MSNLYNMFPKKQATTPASIVSFDDAAGLPVAKMKVALEPIQDLHGYSNPWPAGGGKNLLQLEDATNKAIGSTGVTATIANGKITLSGTSTNGGGRTTRLSPYFTLKAGTYIISPALNTGAYVRGYLNKKSDNSVVGNYSGTSFTVSEDVEVYYGIGIDSGYDYTGIEVKPQLETGSTITSWVPYSNICPITGRTGVSVYGTGKNLLPKQNISGGMSSVTVSTDSDGVITINGTASAYGQVLSDSTFVLNAGTYFFKPFVVSGSKIGYSTSQVRSADGLVTYCSTDVGASFTLTEQTELKARVAYNSGTVIDNLKLQLMISLGEEDPSEYVPYDGSTYAVDWTTEAGTVYGGTLDVVTGKLTVKWAKSLVDANSLTNNGSLVDKYKVFYHVVGRAYTENVICNYFSQGSSSGENYFVARTNGDGIEFTIQNSLIGVQQNDDDNTVKLPAAKAWFSQNNVELCYELATPVEYQLTPQEIVLLRGVMNNVWPSEGTITEFEYYTDFVPGRISNAYIDGRSLQDDGWYLKWRELSAPVPKTDLTPIPGKDGSIDQTEVFGDVYYEDRSLFLDMKYIGEKEWETAYSELLDAIHGQKCMVQFEKDPYWYWIARLIASNYKSKEHFLSMSGTAFPYKLYVVEESVSSSVSGLVEGTAATVELAGSRMRTSPKVIVTGSITLKWGNATKTLSAGTYYVSGLKVGKEGLTVKVWGTGTVTFKYRKGAL